MAEAEPQALDPTADGVQAHKLHGLALGSVGSLKEFKILGSLGSLGSLTEFKEFGGLGFPTPNFTPDERWPPACKTSSRRSLPSWRTCKRTSLPVLQKPRFFSFQIVGFHNSLGALTLTRGCWGKLRKNIGNSSGFFSIRVLVAFFWVLVGIGASQNSSPRTLGSKRWTS